MTYNSFLKKKVEENPELENNLAYNGWIFEIGFNIAQARKKAKITQQELAKKAKVKQSMVARIESGHNMTCETLWKISNSLDLELDIFGANKRKEEKKLKYLLK